MTKDALAQVRRYKRLDVRGWLLAVSRAVISGGATATIAALSHQPCCNWKVVGSTFLIGALTSLVSLLAKSPIPEEQQ